MSLYLWKKIDSNNGKIIIFQKMEKEYMVFTLVSIQQMQPKAV